MSLFEVVGSVAAGEPGKISSTIAFMFRETLLSLSILGFILRVKPTSCLEYDSLVVVEVVFPVNTDIVLPTYIVDGVLFIHKIEGSLNFFAAPNVSSKSNVAPSAKPCLIVGIDKPKSPGLKASAGPPRFALNVYNPLFVALPANRPNFEPIWDAFVFDISRILAFT